jgi:hypothetical protein
VAGMFMLLRREAFAQVGGFDERYFMYCEDFDLCARLRLAGWHVVAGSVSLLWMKRLLAVPKVSCQAVLHDALGQRASNAQSAHEVKPQAGVAVAAYAEEHALRATTTIGTAR